MINEEQSLHGVAPKVESCPILLLQTEKYIPLIKALEKDPRDGDLWSSVVDLAKSEEQMKEAKQGFYAHIPLEELIAVGERLRTAATMRDKYKILAESCSTGELWFDIILGHVDDKNLGPLTQALTIRSDGWERGLDVGTGPGNSLRAVAPHCRNIVGLDKLDFFLDLSRKHPQFPRNATLAQGDATDLRTQFGKESFDLVVSNGLTIHLTEEQMKEFIKGLRWIIKEHGSYFETFALKEPEDLLQATEREYLTSAKGVMTCLLDRLMSHEDRLSSMDFKAMVSYFKLFGFEVIPHGQNEENIVVVQFRKKRKILSVR